ncbi:MAG TPA: VIT and VWA domain-containing protein [Pyrinomonadaceae bacterium]|nr:VIT and VWA domain-containing protein [Pyrinomonadaceae bacterium]
MNKGNAKILFGLILSAFCFSIAARAQGVIVPIICDRRPCVPSPRPIPPRPIIPTALPVKSINIDTKINGQVATTHLVQVFRNDTPYTLEGTYFFPIPETASIVEFAIWENGKKLVGEVRTREEARRIYEEIVRRQRDPGLLEYVGKNLFQASIFPIPPHSDKKLEMTYTQVLKAESGTVAYRYPLGTGQRAWVEPSRTETTRGSRPDIIGTVSGRIEIQSKEALRNIYSPSHSIDVRKKGENGAVLTFETSEKNLLDFQLFYGLSAQDFGLTLLTYREAAKDGFFLLLVSPKDNILERELVSKDIVFVLDTSGSMADEGKMEKARSALLFGIRSLRDADRFNVINFAGEEHLMESGLIAANAEGKRRGEEFVKKLQPTGGTNINDALLAAKKQFNSGSGGERPKILVFMTDGLPTVGETNVEKIIANFNDKEKIEGLRLFNFGVGYDVNTTLLDKLASLNSGAADYVEPKEDLEIKVSNFFGKVNFPVLTDLEIDFGGVQTELIYPRKTPDLFKGSQIALIGRYKTFDDKTVITLRGRDGREIRTFRYGDLNFPQRDEENAFLPKLWAIRRVGWLTEQIRTNGEQKELKDEIIQLGTRYGIVTPYTSFLAMENLQRSARNEESLKVFQDAAPRAAKEKSGQGAVTLSRNTMAQQNTVTIAAADKDDNEIISFSTDYSQQVGTKNFYNVNNVWQDAEFDERQRNSEVKIQFASEEYFALLAREKDLAQFFALGEEVVVVWKGKVYRVVK